MPRPRARRWLIAVLPVVLVALTCCAVLRPPAPPRPLAERLITALPGGSWSPTEVTRLVESYGTACDGDLTGRYPASWRSDRVGRAWVDGEVRVEVLVLATRGSDEDVIKPVRVGVCYSEPPGRYVDGDGVRWWLKLWPNMGGPWPTHHGAGFFGDWSRTRSWSPKVAAEDLRETHWYFVAQDRALLALRIDHPHDERRHVEDEYATLVTAVITAFTG